MEVLGLKIKINKKMCTGCKLCARCCPFDAIEFQNKYPIFNENCNLCGLCVNECTTGAISIPKKIPEKDLSSYHGILSFIELTNGDIRASGLEILSAARKLADTIRESCSVLLIGTKADAFQKILWEYGADLIYSVENDRLQNYSTEHYTDIVGDIAAKYKPSIVLFGATKIGRDLAPRVAARLNTGLTADCTDLQIDEKGHLLQVRPTYGGNILAQIITPNHRPQIATVRPNVMKKIKLRSSNESKDIIHRISVKLKDKKGNLRIIKEIKQFSPFSNLEEADYIISGGIGLGSPEKFKILQYLINILSKKVGENRIALGASRAAVDAGWISHHHQVGQTGKTVSPKLYIACGISGQVQHLMGMRDAEKVIAINRDRNAPIFSIADIGIVGDVHEVVPKLSSQIEHMLCKQSRVESKT